MFPPCFSAADAVAVTSPARGVLTLGFVDLAVISALRDLGEQVPLNLACLLEDPVVTQGSDLLLLLRFGHRAAEAKLRTAHFALRECPCGGLCSQTPFTSCPVCKQCSEAHVPVIRASSVVFELPLVPGEVTQHPGIATLLQSPVLCARGSSQRAPGFGVPPQACRHP